MDGIVLGLGEVGSALQEVLGCDGYDNATYEPFTPPRDRYNVLHVAFPYHQNFSEDVRSYQQLFSAELTIIYSTVPIGTSEALGAVHSPIEGKHPNLADSIRRHTRWLGSTDPGLLQVAVNVWLQVPNWGLVKTVESADFTEFLKLRSTSRYGVALAFANYEYEVASRLGMDGVYLQNFDEDYNDLYEGTGAQRYVLTDPRNHIGGHCVVPNAVLLEGQYPHELLRQVIKLG
jgi:hypothetical protein